MFGVYISFFLMVTLMILVGATWTGLYLAKRITRPIQMLAAAARDIGAGHLDHRLEPETSDEFGSLVEAFNAMAGELSHSRQDLERSTRDLQRQHQEVEARRRYIETMLERITTGVVSVDAGGRVTTINSAAARLLGLDDGDAGRPGGGPARAPGPGAARRADRTGAARRRGARRRRRSRWRVDGRELHLAAAAARLHGEGGASEGTVLVFDDITPLIRAQKVAAWREVARRLAHEIKNPLTPIQLCAERLAPALPVGAPGHAGARGGVHEDDRRRGRVAQGAGGRVLAVRPDAGAEADPDEPADAARRHAGALRRPVPRRDDRVCQSPPDLPLVRVDPEQIRRVIINLVDNAIEAMDRKGRVVIELQHAAAERVVRIIVADNGPGIPAGEREKLFMPYYSTKRRGSGLGLAIVRRIVAEHGGAIEVTDNTPRGTRFVIELPA